ncbi:DNA excision repair protein ERCC-1 [Vanrija pseudolonga]|uniref:DNA excision repair protein ERCC-1 n=1 Tax=Vanrija pseudolonga TaxID=143232 RepID=A0AAF0YF49_9TREE|nr:DNA excision repair protein ERCC-1 [Vanrija pseudolonga]
MDTEAGPSTSTPGPSAPGFQSASALPRSTHVPSLSSNRNASGGLPAPPRPVAESSTAAQDASTAAPSKPVNRPSQGKNAIVYNAVQRRNPVLGLIRNMNLEIGDIVADYQVGAHNGVLFLSLKYHRLHPEYIHGRIEKMKNAYSMRILLILCDITEHQQSIRELSKHAVINDLSVFVAWSNAEAAQYLATFKAYEHKSADSLKEKVHQTYPAQLEHVLTSGRKVNKSNAEALAAQFGAFANIVQQTNHTLGGVKGLGPVKVVSLLDAFNKPFVAGGRRKAGAVTTSVSTAPQASAPSDIVETEKHDDDGEGGFTPEPDLRVVGETAAEAQGSPDWPDQPEDPPTPPTPTRPRDTGPSRSPSVEPDPERTATDTVWDDPLAGDSDEDEGPAAKRQRV